MNLELDELICRFECAILSRSNPPFNATEIYLEAEKQALIHTANRMARERRERESEREMVGV